MKKVEYKVVFIKNKVDCLLLLGDKVIGEFGSLGSLLTYCANRDIVIPIENCITSDIKNY